MMDDNWSVVFAVLFIMAVILVMGLIYPDPRGARGSEERAARERRERVEWACWCDEWAETRAAQEAYLRERRGK